MCIVWVVGTKYEPLQLGKYSLVQVAGQKNVQDESKVGEEKNRAGIQEEM